MYITIGWTKFVEQDVYADGCVPGTEQINSGGDTFIGDTTEALLVKLVGLMIGWMFF